MLRSQVVEQVENWSEVSEFDSNREVGFSSGLSGPVPETIHITKLYGPMKWSNTYLNFLMVDPTLSFKAKCGNKVLKWMLLVSLSWSLTHLFPFEPIMRTSWRRNNASNIGFTKLLVTTSIFSPSPQFPTTPTGWHQHRPTLGTTK